MLSGRLIALVVVAVAAFAAMVVAGQGGCAGGAGAPSSAPASPAPPATTAATAPPSAVPGDAPATADADALEAVRTLKRFCDLVASHRLHAAAGLLAGSWVWPRRELLPIASLRLVSARVQDARQAGAVVLLARLRARLRGPSPLHDGVNTLFVTLGRDGTTGGWLITAVTTSP
jgi:hypothetical protein